MPRRLTNLLLLALVLGLATSGWLGWVLPAARAGPFYDLHRLCGAALLLVLGWKYGIARLSLRRRTLRRRCWLHVLLRAVHPSEGLTNARHQRHPPHPLHRHGRRLPVAARDPQSGLPKRCRFSSS